MIFNGFEFSISLHDPHCRVSDVVLTVHIGLYLGCIPVIWFSKEPL